MACCRSWVRCRGFGDTGDTWDDLRLGGSCLQFQYHIATDVTATVDDDLMRIGSGIARRAMFVSVDQQIGMHDFTELPGILFTEVAAPDQTKQVTIRLPVFLFQWSVENGRIESVFCNRFWKTVRDQNAFGNADADWAGSDKAGHGLADLFGSFSVEGLHAKTERQVQHAALLGNREVRNFGQLVIAQEEMEAVRERDLIGRHVL